MLHRAICALAIAACVPTGGEMSASATTGLEASTSSTSTGDASTSALTTGSTSATSTGSEAAPDLPPPCPVGSLGCACTQGGACDGGLVCEAGTCAEGCQIGSLGCKCTEGGGCDAGLTCSAGECIEGVSPPCDSESQVLDDCCGDNVLDDFEECDKGYLNADDADCTSACKVATCGDGLVHELAEACDGEAYCTAECTFKTCGDGVRDPWEWCDPVRPGDPDCTPLCTDARKVIFITSTHYKGGDLGGLAGADAKCQEHADGAALDGTFKAWLATDPSNAPSSTWAWSHAPYVSVDGALLFEYWKGGGDLCMNGNLPDEHGNPHPGCDTLYKGTDLWAWMVSDFSDAGPSTCNGWTSEASTGGAVLLLSCSVDPPNGAACSAAAPIICVEQ